jgi:hypothetical protein
VTGKFDQFRALSGPEQRALIAAALLLPSFWLGLRVLGLRRFQSLLRRPAQIGAQRRTGIDPARLGYLVNAAANHTLLPATCLTRSLLLDWWLRRRGIDSSLRIGVRVVDRALEAHAWVECGGRPVNDALDVGIRFTAFEGQLHPQSFSAP